ncbi:MAG: HPr family phosphocarrier protein [Treponema sp.]|nr:HPr family phosphocarrier protein [Treponema sp.]
MVRKEYKVNNPSGLHTRPGNNFVKTAKQFSSDITITKNENTVDGKSLLKIMKANIIQGDTVIITCTGPDENQALDGLDNFFASLN